MTGLGEHQLAEQALRIRSVAPSVHSAPSRGTDTVDGVESLADNGSTAEDRSMVDAQVVGLAVDVDAGAAIFWTSGTEAEPTAVRRCHGEWLVMAVGTA
jgi:hypothetical protein